MAASHGDRTLAATTPGEEAGSLSGDADVDPQ
jgi:hypothetical protein